MSVIDGSYELDLHRTLLLAAVGLGTLGTLFYNVMPLYLGSLQDSSSLSHSQIGLGAGSLFLGFNLLSASAYYWINNISFRVAAVVSVLCLCVFLGLKMYVTTFTFIIVLSVLIGSASGALSSISAKIISEARNVNFWYAIKSATESGAGVMLLFLLPVTLIPIYGFNGTILAMLMVIFSVALMSFRFLPSKQSQSEVDGQRTDEISARAKESNVPVLFALATILILDMGGSAIWAFEERIAILYGFDPEWVGTVLGMSLFFAVIGPGIAAFLGDRLGNRLPFSICVSLMLCGVIAVISSNENNVYFAIGACVFLFGWGASVPFMFSQVAVTDPNGRYITLAMPAMGIGSMLGPIIAGFLFSEVSLAPIQTMVMLVLLISMSTIWLSDQKKYKSDKLNDK